MKILCIIDSLGSGGAQRQITTIAVGLKKRGHEVRFIVYHSNDHFMPVLEKENIRCDIIQVSSYIKRIYRIRKILREGWQDVVLAFLEASVLYTELSILPRQKWGLVIGERSANPTIKNNIKIFQRQFHRLADYIVCNSYTNQLMLEKKLNFIKDKIYTVYNTVDMEKFSLRESINRNDDNIVRFIIAAGYHENKNMINVAKAVSEIKNNNISNFKVIWYGSQQNDMRFYNDVIEYVKINRISEHIQFNDKTQYIEEKIHECDIVCLFSYFEGLPNFICEGMACGKPVLMSKVCDATNLVEEGKNGYLCDPYSYKDIAEKMMRMIEKKDELKKYGKYSRSMAEQLFNENKIIDSYQSILEDSMNNKKIINNNLNWPKKIPTSAVETVNNW